MLSSSVAQIVAKLSTSKEDTDIVSYTLLTIALSDTKIGTNQAICKLYLELNCFSKELKP